MSYTPNELSMMRGQTGGAMPTQLRFATGLAAALLTAALHGCTPGPPRINLIRSVEIVPQPQQALGLPLAFVIKGSGTCERFDIDWGDGSTSNSGTAQPKDCLVNPDPAQPSPHFRCSIEHTYSGWAGGKTVTVTAKQGCEGKVNTRFVTDPSELGLGFGRPGVNFCDTFPGKPHVQARTVVNVRTEPINRRCPGIWYDNLNPHCYDAEGIPEVATSPTSADPLTFPFFGMRKYSLVLKVGTQVVQGGTYTSFVTNQSGALEFCVNEPHPRDGVGGYSIYIRTNELGPPP